MVIEAQRSSVTIWMKSHSQKMEESTQEPSDLIRPRLTILYTPASLYVDIWSFGRTERYINNLITVSWCDDVALSTKVEHLLSTCVTLYK